MIWVIVLAILASTPAVFGQQHPGQERTKVLILGAGAAGLSAAKSLTESGIDDFIILEGSNRIGGRVKAAKFAGKTVEAGANWIVGKKNNPLYFISQELSFGGKNTDWDSIILRNSKGEDVTDTEGEAAWDKLGEAQEGIRKLADQLRVEKTDVSLRTCLDVNQWQPKTAVENAIEILDYDFEFAHSPGVTSCLNLDGVVDELDDVFYVQDERGYEFLLKTYVKDAITENDPRVRLNEVVKSVAYNWSNVSVETEEGKVYVADYAIMTFSVGVIKSGEVKFNPPLPYWKVNALYRVRMENYMGLYFKFPEDTTRFWDETEFVLYADERRGYFPVFMNLEAEGLKPAGTNILEIATFGEDADRVSRLTDAEIIEEVMALLRRVYSGATIPDPESFFYENWRNNKLYHGSFPNAEAGVPIPDVFSDIIRPVGRLNFAGDAYDEKYLGYVLGALKSGRKAAKRVALNLLIPFNLPPLNSF